MVQTLTLFNFQAFLRPIKDRPNLDIALGAQVLVHLITSLSFSTTEIQAMRVLIDPVSKVAKGVKFRQVEFVKMSRLSFSPGGRVVCTTSWPIGKLF